MIIPRSMSSFPHRALAFKGLHVVKQLMVLVMFVGLSVVAGCGEEDSGEVKQPTIRDKSNIDVSRTINLLSHREPRVRISNAFILGELGAEASSAIPALEKLTNDPDPRVQQAATDAIAKIQGAGEEEEGEY